MKLSLSWIFDHIDGDYKNIDMVQFVERFNTTTAEIEGFEAVKLDVDSLSLVQITAQTDEKVSVFSPEWDKEIVLSPRIDAKVGNFYLIKKDGDSYFWATVEDFHCPKEGLAPAVRCDETLIDGGWKKEYETQDYILEVDNKSVTHRPDMWGHRGFAREVAALLGMPFRSIDEFVKDKEIKDFKEGEVAKDENGFTLRVEDPTIGKRFAGLYITNIKARPSSLQMALRLMRVGSRAIDFIVDVTNYVMLDLSQPMHAFDAQKLTDKTIMPRLAKKGEKLVLLDDAELELMPTDYVVADSKKPVALAGIMGGKDSGIDPDTHSLFLESANFDASTIRRTALRFHVRTDASSRFEKSLDPNQNVTGILRLLKIFEDEKIEFEASDYILSFGKRAQENEVVVEHCFIEKRLGADIDYEFVVKTLESIEFGVETHKKNDHVAYTVTIPTFRGTKDVRFPIDIVEEVGRFFGYENICFELPQKETKPYDLDPVLQIRRIKNQLAFGLKMHEASNYPFFDEEFIRKLGWEPANYAQVDNPLSQNWKRLVTSLIPHLIKDIDQNVARYDTLRFFEFARTWSREKDIISEKKSLAGIFFDVKKIDFYCAKSWVSSLFNMLGMEVVWKKVDADELKKSHPWFFPYQTAHIFYGDILVGTAGKLDPSFYATMFEGDAFGFELDGDFLTSYKVDQVMYKAKSKYPEVIRDVSMFVPLSVTVDHVVAAISSCDDKIAAVLLVDSFQKDGWEDKKSLTFRFILQDYKKTLEKDEVDAVYSEVVAALKGIGAEVR